MKDQSVARVLSTPVQWDGIEIPKPKINITDSEVYRKSAKEKQRHLEKQIGELPIDANWEAGLQHALSKMGMFYNDAYLDLKESVERIAEMVDSKAEIL